MSKTAVVFFTLLLVLASCLITGCSSLSFSGTPAAAETASKINVGITGHERLNTSGRIAFEAVASDLASSNFVVPENIFIAIENTTAANVSPPPVSPAPEKHIKSIRGENLDESGDASSWTFIVEQGDQIVIVTYDNRGMIFSSSPGTVKRSEIFLDQIIAPRDLFRKNHDLIFDTIRTGTSVTRDLSLSEGACTISISGSGAPRILVFDAKTGALRS